MKTTLMIAYLKLMRIPAVFTAMSNIIAAHFIATQGQIEWILLFQLLAISSLLYSAGMILNDCFDLDLDKRERPTRPLASGEISVRHAWLAGWLFIAVALIIASFAGATILIITCLIILFVVGYNAYFKHTLLASFTMATCRYLNWLLGLSVVDLTMNSFLIPVPVLIYIYALTTVSQIETSADSKKPVIYCMFGIGLAAASIVALYFLSTIYNPWVFVFLFIGVAVVFNKIADVYNNLDSNKVQGLVRFLILGVIPLDAMLVYAYVSWWMALLILLLLLPGRFFARMISVT